MSKIERITNQINELKEHIKQLDGHKESLEREIEVLRLNEHIDSIVNTNRDKNDDRYSSLLNERSVYTFGLPRGVGKTRFIIDQVKKNENLSVIWVNNILLGRMISDEYLELPEDRCIMLCGSNIRLPRGLNSDKPITRILVDEYQKLSGENLIRIYNDCIRFNRGVDVEIKIIRVGTPQL